MVRLLSLISTIVLGGALLAGCQSPTAGSSEQAATYQCPQCKQTVAWHYRNVPGDKGGKGFGLPGQRVVEHTCPECKKTWESAMSATTTCSICGEEHRMCPICQSMKTINSLQ